MSRVECFRIGSVALVVAICIASAAQVRAAFVDPTLPGTTLYDGWESLTQDNFPVGSYFVAPWSSSIPANSSGSSGSTLFKTAGGGAPASESIYTPNIGGFGITEGPGGTFEVTSSNPVAGVKNVVFQTAIGDGPPAPDLFAVPTLSFNGLSQDLAADFIGTTTIETIPSANSPSGFVDLHYRYYQWDLSEVLAPIMSLGISFTTGAHAQIYALQLDQSNAVPEPSSAMLLAIGSACFATRLRSNRRRQLQFKR